MAAPRQLEFFTLRYVPDAVKDEFVNIGLVLLEPGGEFAELRFTSDWSRVRCLDPAADLDLLQALEAELQRELRAGQGDRDKLLARLHDSFSNLLQISAKSAVLAADPAAEVDRLAQLYLEPAEWTRAERLRDRGRAAIVRRMRSAFEQAGVWQAMLHHLRAADYGLKGDPLRIDCGYRPKGNGLIKMFQGLSLASDANPAKLLAFSYPHLAAGLGKKEGARAALTAVVEDSLDRESEMVAFALDTLERSSIAVATTADLPQLADTAHRELGL
jgi:hypothetical protein